MSTNAAAALATALTKCCLRNCSSSSSYSNTSKLVVSLQNKKLSSALIRTASTAASNTSSSSNDTSNTTTTTTTTTTTHFGYQDVPINEKEAKVRQVFESVAESYDVMNDLMSGGLHRLWKDELCSMTGLAATSRAIRSSIGDKELKILDVAGGTGDVAFRFVEAMNCIERAKSTGTDEASVTVCDINAEMLRVGERRARQRFGNDLLDASRALKFRQGNAECLPFEDDTFDLYTIAFGLRNVTNVDKALEDAKRVLKPGGRYLCLEFSQVENPLLRSLYDAYSFRVIPNVGDAVAGDRDSYQYLVESIRKFGNQDLLKERMERVGFEGVKFTNMTGGIVAVHEGWKPL